MQALKEAEDKQERNYRESQSSYNSDGGLRYRPEDFHFLKVLGKGSFGKVKSTFRSLLYVETQQMAKMLYTTQFIWVVKLEGWTALPSGVLGALFSFIVLFIEQCVYQIPGAQSLCFVF